MTEEEFLAAYMSVFGNPLLMSREVLLSQKSPDMEEFLQIRLAEVQSA